MLNHHPVSIYLCINYKFPAAIRIRPATNDRAADLKGQGQQRIAKFFPEIECSMSRRTTKKTK
jgi:hypothetical protein